MAQRLKKHRETLLVLTKASPQLIKTIIKTASPSLIQALSECALNILEGNITLSPTQKRKLVRFKDNLRFLAKKRASIKKKKEILQTGRFVGILASLVAPLIFEGIGSLVKHIQNKKKKQKK